MKVQKITILFVFLFISTAVFCQIEKGRIIASGDIHTGFTIQEGAKSFTVSPYISGGYFVSNNILIQANFNCGISKTTFENGFGGDEVYSSRQLGGGLGIRYYFKTETIQPFFGISSDFANHKQTFFGDNYSNQWLIPKIALGLNYFINENVSLQFSVPASYLIQLDQGEIPNIEARGININPALGFLVFIR